MNNSPWPERDQELRDLWDVGHSTAEIGRRMSLSKGSIVGRAHRLDLPSRPSPIIRDPDFARRPVVGVKGPTLPPLSSVTPLMPMARATAAISVAPLKTGGRVIECCWPMGDVGSKEFRFCNAQSEPGKPYCAEHQRRGTVRSVSGRGYIPGVPQDERT
jgi:GcrA cell cycle regulator